MSRFNCLLVLLAFSLLIPSACLAQCVYRTINVSRIEGTVADPYGMPIPKVEVKLLRDGKRVASATTNEAGEFSIQATPRKYELNASSQFFAPGVAYIDLGSDLVRFVRPTHLWMILKPGVTVDDCTFTATSRRQFEKAIQKRPQGI